MRQLGSRVAELAEAEAWFGLLAIYEKRTGANAGICAYALELHQVLRTGKDLTLDTLKDKSAAALRSRE